MIIPDEQLFNWTKPAFGNEEEKAKNTETIVREAVNAHPLLRTLKTRVFAKGSFKNNTNVRRDSDIDVAVEYQGMIRLEYTNGADFGHTGLTPYAGDITVEQYKAAVGEAMKSAFGARTVDDTGNRVFKVREGARSLMADVVPCTTYRFYGPTWHRQGIELILNRPDGHRHYNYPDQHYDNGVAKNLRTSKRFKHAVRILKNIEGQLVNAQLMREFPSYVIECLAYNVADLFYIQMTSWRQLIQTICLVIMGYVREPEPLVNRWVEVNDHKWLFHPHQTWTRQDVDLFATLAYRTVTS